MREKRALISVYNKSGIADFAKELIGMGWTILASGGTAAVLKQSGVEVQDVCELVGGGAILGHRVVTLSREIHAGLLAQYNDSDLTEMEKLGLSIIDLVCVDLYPLQEAVTDPQSTQESVIEKTDIGGPAIIRSAAKGRRIVICKVNQRQKVLDWLKQGELNKDDFMTELVAEAELLVSHYCLTSAQYHSHNKCNGIIGEQVSVCKYGENGYQIPANVYSTNNDDPLSLDKFKLRSGTPPSYIQI